MFLGNPKELSLSVPPDLLLAYIEKPDIDMGVIRPPSEAGSLIIRVNENCPWNRCRFCGIYGDGTYKVRSVDDIKRDIDTAKEHYANYEVDGLIKSAFLQDGNALAMKAKDLAEVVGYLRQKFPSLDTITTYSSSRIVYNKKQQEINALKQAGLSRIHVGMESGCGDVLEYMQKGVTPEKHVAAGLKIKQAGIILCEYVLFGLGGQDLTEEHARESAIVLNQIDPDFIRSRRLAISENNPLYPSVQSGEFVQVGDEGIIREQQMFIEGLEGIASEFICDHMNNPLMEVEGKLPEDKQYMLGIFDRFFALSPEDRRIFILGKKLGHFHKLADLSSNEESYDEIKEMLEKFESHHPGRFDDLIFELLAERPL